MSTYSNIQFRWFNHDTKVMTYVSWEDILTNRNLPSPNMNYTVMCCASTGNLGKNDGISFYEGDIVKLENGQVSEIRYESDYGGFIAEWQYHRNQHHKLFNCDEAYLCDLLGNKFENPEIELSEHKIGIYSV